MPETSSNKHVHPKNRRKASVSSSSTLTSLVRSVNDGDYVEETRKSFDRWMGLQRMKTTGKPTETQPQENTDSSTAEVVSEAPSKIAPSHSPSKSILRTPKYTKQSPQNYSVTGNHDDVQEKATKKDLQADPNVVSESEYVCKGIVVERDPTKPMRKRNVKPRTQVADSHATVEGYVPSIAVAPSDSEPSRRDVAGAPLFSNSQQTATKIDSTNIQASIAVKDDSTTRDDKENPIILNSLEDLFEATGDLPSEQSHDRNKITPDTKLVEADIAFSVMTQEQYRSKLTELRKQHEEERQSHLKVFMGIDDIFDEKCVEDDGEASDQDEEDLMEILMGGNEMGEEDYYHNNAEDDDTQAPQPRVFRLLWETLAEWFTPEAAQYLSHLAAGTLHSDSPGTLWKPRAIERSDIEASRCAGLMAMVKLYLPKILEELGFPQELRRTADIRLGELLRSFSYVLEAPKLPVKLWKAMTCILLEIVMVEQHKGKIMTFPPSVSAVGMTQDEYRYLSRTAVKVLGVESP
jgi:hypothetical protein